MYHDHQEFVYCNLYCLHAQVRVFIRFLHAARVHNSRAWLTYHIQNVLRIEQIYDSNFNLYLKMFIEYSNIKSTSLKISDYSVISQTKNVKIAFYS